MKEVKFRLRRTLDLVNIGKEFYHEAKPKEEQLLTATLDHDKGALWITLFDSKLHEQIKELEALNWCLERDNSFGHWCAPCVAKDKCKIYKQALK